MNLRKIFWGIRALFYKLLFSNIVMPSYIGKPIYINHAHNISCGEKVRIYPGMRVEIVNKNNSFIEIGNNVSIGQNFHVVSYNDVLKIGSNVVIAGNVLVTNCDHDYTGLHDSVLENDLIYKKTEIGDNCFIGNNAAILAGTVLGKGCVVGANSVVRGVFPDYTVLAGVPAKPLKKVRI